MPERPQFLPYGFELDSVPLLDADHALIGGTTPCTPSTCAPAR